MHLPGLLKSRRTAIVDRWADLAFRVYPEDPSGFIKGEKDRFRNPVGHVSRESLDALFDGLVEGRPAEAMQERIDGIVRIRAVQELSPSRAMGFVFLLKQAVRESIGEEAGTDGLRAELSGLHAGIDRLALRAFDHYVRCREEVFGLRVHEMKRRMASLLERPEDDPAEDRDGQGR